MVKAIPQRKVPKNHCPVVPFAFLTFSLARGDSVPSFPTQNRELDSCLNKYSKVFNFFLYSHLFLLYVSKVIDMIPLIKLSLSKGIRPKHFKSTRHTITRQFHGRISASSPCPFDLRQLSSRVIWK